MAAGRGVERCGNGVMMAAREMKRRFELRPAGGGAQQAPNCHPHSLASSLRAMTVFSQWHHGTRMTALSAVHRLPVAFSNAKHFSSPSGKSGGEREDVTGCDRVGQAEHDAAVRGTQTGNGSDGRGMGERGTSVHGEDNVYLAAAAAAGRERWFDDKYATTSKAAAVLLRNKFYRQVEAGIKFFNEKSGWTEVEKLKNAISSLETSLREAQDKFKRVRAELDQSQQTHRSVQDEIASLSAAKQSWTDSQFRQYQDYLEQERVMQRRLATLQQDSKNAEVQVDESLRDLMEGLRKRFHEEQLWTDRIRQMSMWSTIAILFANSLIFLFTYALRFREKAIVTANLAAIREDLKRQDSIHATLLLLQQQVSEMREEVAQHVPWRRTSGGARDIDNGKVAEALLMADSGAVGGSSRDGAVDTLSSGVVGTRPSALGASGIASVSPAATSTCPTADKGKNHQRRTTAAGGGDDGVQRAQSGCKAEGSRKTMLLGWYVGAACLASWAVGRAMPYAG